MINILRCESHPKIVRVLEALNEKHKFFNMLNTTVHIHSFNREWMKKLFIHYAINSRIIISDDFFKLWN